MCHLTSAFSPVTDGGAPAGGGFLKRADLMPAADCAPDVWTPVAADDGAPAADSGSPKGADLALTADSAPGECLSVARYRLLHHTAVSFMSSDIRVLLRR